jgi:predicted phage tail protein
MKIYRAANAIKAIDANRKNFQKRIFELAKEGFNYTIIVDGKKITELAELNLQKEPQEVHLVPLIIGSGGALLVGGLATALGGSAGFASAGIGLFLANVVTGVIVTAVSMGLQKLCQNLFLFLIKQTSLLKDLLFQLAMGDLRLDLA